jgi:hypothetical protein
VFVESARNVQQFDVLDHFDTVPELVGRVFNQPRKAALQLQQQAAMQPCHLPMHELHENQSQERAVSHRQAPMPNVS